MAMFGSSKETRKEPVSATTPNSSTTIGKGATIDGNIETYGNVRVDGKILGNIKSKAKVVLGEESHLEGSVLAQNAEIAGKLQGLLEIAEILLLKSTAVVNGDIICNKLIVESGAVFNGSCKMGANIKEIRIDNHNDTSKNRQQPKQAV